MIAIPRSSNLSSGCRFAQFVSFFSYVAECLHSFSTNRQRNLPRALQRRIGSTLWFFRWTAIGSGRAKCTSTNDAKSKVRLASWTHVRPRSRGRNGTSGQYWRACQIRGRSPGGFHRRRPTADADPQALSERVRDRFRTRPACLRFPGKSMRPSGRLLTMRAARCGTCL